MPVLRQQDAVQAKKHTNESQGSIRTMADISKETEKKISQLQLMEQSMQGLSMQKQQFQLQQIEVESAMKELENVDEAYKIVGNIMVLSKKTDITGELNSKKEIIELRIKNLEKQENHMRDKASKLQNEILKEMKQD